MKKIIAAFVLLASVSFAAEETSTRIDDIKAILNRTFLAPQSEPLVNMMAMEAIAESHKKIDPDELVAQFRESLENEEKLAQLCEHYEPAFSDEEVHELRKLHEHPISDKWAEHGMEICQAQMQTMKDAFKALALTTEVVEDAEVAEEAALAVLGDVIQITQDNYDQTVGEGSLPMVIDVNASWCGPCQMMNPIIDELSAEYQGQVQFGKIDFDAESELAQQYDVTSLPTILFLKPGQQEPVMKNVGFISKKDLKAKIGQLLKK